jgi:hypothetical protein
MTGSVHTDSFVAIIHLTKLKLPLTGTANACAERTGEKQPAHCSAVQRARDAAPSKV